MTHRLFVYGTLMFPPVMEIVTGQRFRSGRAVLHGYSRHPVSGQVFPGIVPRQGTDVTGVLYDGIGADHLQWIDRFESGIYHRQTVSVVLDGGNRVPAGTYVIRPGYRHWLLAAEEWDPELFEQRHLQAYLQRLRGFRCRP